MKIIHAIDFTLHPGGVWKCKCDSCKLFRRGKQAMFKAKRKEKRAAAVGHIPNDLWGCKCAECFAHRRIKHRESYDKHRSDPARVEQDRAYSRSRYHVIKYDPVQLRRMADSRNKYLRSPKGNATIKLAKIKYMRRVSEERPELYEKWRASAKSRNELLKEAHNIRRKDRGYDKKYLERNPASRKATLRRYAKKWWATRTPEQREKIRAYNRSWFRRRYRFDPVFRANWNRASKEYRKFEIQNSYAANKFSKPSAIAGKRVCRNCRKSKPPSEFKSKMIGTQEIYLNCILCSLGERVVDQIARAMESGASQEALRLIYGA